MPPVKHHHALPDQYQLNVYRIEHVIGQGGFGITYLGEDNLDRKVAIKEYLPTELATRIETDQVQPISSNHQEMYQWGLERFLDEAKTLARFKHPNIVSILSFFEANGTAYAVMPYEEGECFDKLIRQDKHTDEASLVAMLMPILDGLENIHDAGLIHRDIKPANIFIRHDGSPVLIDFGSARTAMGEHDKTLTALVSPGFAPFEQYHGSGTRQGPWTDIYALGSTLYAALNRGRGPTEATIRADLLLQGKPDPLQPATEIAEEGHYSEVFLNAIDAAIAFNPDERPQNIAQWRKLFHALQPAAIQENKLAGQQEEDIETVIHTRNIGKRRPPVNANTGKSETMRGSAGQQKFSMSKPWQLAMMAILLLTAIMAATWSLTGEHQQPTAQQTQPAPVPQAKDEAPVDPQALLYEGEWRVILECDPWEEKGLPAYFDPAEATIKNGRLYFRRSNPGDKDYFTGRGQIYESNRMIILGKRYAKSKKADAPFEFRGKFQDINRFVSEGSIGKRVGCSMQLVR